MSYRIRDDISRFLVHLTRNYGGASAEDNLFAILRRKRIEARNAHCLFGHKFDHYGFSALLKKKFNTVCFTEAPFPQIRFLVSEIPGRNIRLQPFGLVFKKSSLLDRGVSPAIYLNAKGTQLREYLLRQFGSHFKTRSLYRNLVRDFHDDADSIINYYSLINIISDDYDFSWEREWRFPGHLEFDYDELYAIIARNPKQFEQRCGETLPDSVVRYVSRIPVVYPEWNYERVIEEFSVKLWKQ
jgi:hypothetical protein